MKDNIVLIIDSLEGGGAEKVTLRLAEIFLQKNYNVTIITIENNIDYYINKDIKVTSLNYKKSKKPELIQNIIYAYKLHKVLKSISNKKLIIGSLTLSNTFMNLINNMYNFYYILHVNITKSKIDTRTGIKRFVKKRQLEKLYNNKNIICVSKGVEKDILSLGVKPKSIQVIYNPFDSQEIRDKAKEEIDFLFPKDDYLVHVGRFAKQKRHDILIQAFSQIENKTIKLVLVGQGKKKEIDKIKQLISDLNLEGRVIFAGFFKNPFPIIKNAKALVLSSNREGFGNVIVEALILDVPVVSTDCLDGPNEILIGPLEQFLAKVDDPNDLANKINLVLSTQITIDNHIIERFEADKIFKQYLNLIE